MWKRRRTDELEAVNLLEMVPVRLAEWQENSGHVVIVRPKFVRPGPLGLIDHLLHLLSARRIRLDAIGSFAWLQLDGTRSVGQVVVLLRKEFGDKVEPAEERVGHLIRVFRSQQFVAYPNWDQELLGTVEVLGQLR